MTLKEKETSPDGQDDKDENFHLEPAEPADRQEEIGSLVSRLHEGSLSQDEQQHLSRLLDMESDTFQIVAARRESFSGPIPHPELLQQYDDETRKAIVQMAVNDQRHVHEMQRLGLEGSISKDTRGQRYGLTIALAGLGVAAIIAPYSPVGASLFGSINLVGLVTVFVAPRILQARSKNKESDKSSSLQR